MIIAIDPGASGAIVCLNGKGMVDVKKMPETDMDIVDHFNCLLTNCREKNEKVMGFLEKVSGTVGLRDKYVSCKVCKTRARAVAKCFKCGRSIDVKEGDPATRAFNFGSGYGFVRAQFVTRKIPFENPTPQKWQKGLSLGKKDGYGYEANKNWKNKLKARAQEYFPSIKVTLWNADALLILKYAILLERNK